MSVRSPRTRLFLVSLCVLCVLCVSAAGVGPCVADTEITKIPETTKVRDCASGPLVPDSSLCPFAFSASFVSAPQASNPAGLTQRSQRSQRPQKFGISHLVPPYPTPLCVPLCSLRPLCQRRRRQTLRGRHRDHKEHRDHKGSGFRVCLLYPTPPCVPLRSLRPSNRNSRIENHISQMHPEGRSPHPSGHLPQPPARQSREGRIYDFRFARFDFRRHIRLRRWPL